MPSPVVLAGIDNSWRVCKEEVFGPVLVAIPFETEEEVIRMANDTVYGLAAYVFTQDVTAAFRVTEQIDAGWLQVNRAGGQIPACPTAAQNAVALARNTLLRAPRKVIPHGRA